MTAKSTSVIDQIPAEIRADIYAHVMSSPDAEVAGILVGRVDRVGGRADVRGTIRADYAVGEHASVTFTHETWDRVIAQQEEHFPSERIVGWYHSHPNFGIFLSEHDRFIHNNFFSDGFHLAYVVDPIRKREGMFGWRGGELVELEEREVPTGESGELVAAEHRLTLGLDDLDVEPLETDDPLAAPPAGGVLIAVGDEAAPAGYAAGGGAGASVGAGLAAGAAGAGSAAAAPRATIVDDGAVRRRRLLIAGAAAVLVLGGAGAALLGGGETETSVGTPEKGVSLQEANRAAKQLTSDGDAAAAALKDAMAQTQPTPTPTAKPVAPVTEGDGPVQGGPTIEGGGPSGGGPSGGGPSGGGPSGGGPSGGGPSGGGPSSGDESGTFGGGAR